MLPRNRTATSVLVKVRVARKSSDLKLGYFTLLTIIQERNSSSTGRQYRQLPVANSFSSHQIMNSVSEATRPAAEGIGKPRNSLRVLQAHGRQAVEPRQPERAAEQINRGDEPAPFLVAAKHVLEHDPMHQEGRRRPERDQVRQRIELAPKRAFHAAHPRHPAVKQVKDARQQDEPERHLDLLKIAAGNVGFDDLGQRHEPAEQVARRQQVRQEVDLQLRLARAVERRIGRRRVPWPGRSC